MAIRFKGAHFSKEVILMGVRWYVSYPLNTRHVEELMEERGLRRKRVSCLFVCAHC
jgi:putative transposase